MQKIYKKINKRNCSVIKKKKEGGGQKANRHFLRTQWQMCLLG